MYKLLLLFAFMMTITCFRTYSQVAINTDGSPPDPSAFIDVKSTTKGLLPPRMTNAQIIGISSPVAGSMVYNTSLNSICLFNGTAWDMWETRDGQSCGSVVYGGKTYNTVIIGMQCWMTENLNIGTAIPGTQEQADNGIIEKYCYDDMPANCDIFGGLYQWAEIVQYLNGATNGTSWNPAPTGDVQGICPAGWHLANDAEWSSLAAYLGGASVAGGKMKSTWFWAAPNAGATNSSGFTGMPAGDRDVSGSFIFQTIYGDFWTASESNSTQAWYRNLNNSNETLYRGGYYKSDGFAARCLK